MTSSLARHALLAVGLAGCASQPAAELRTRPREQTAEPSLDASGLIQADSELKLEAETFNATTTTVTVTTPASVEVWSLPEAPTVETDEEWAYREYVLGCIRSYEQGADGYATETGNGFSSAYQFIPSTWAYAVTGAGHPEWAGRRASEAPPWIQDAAAWWLFLHEGYGAWPTPQAMC